MKDQLEFYVNNVPIAAVESSMVPPVGSLISIRAETWEVVRVTYALDYSDRPADFRRRMRANIDLKVYLP